ncbi:MAG: EAL domain-containing protein [Frankiaceae bacterium]
MTRHLSGTWAVHRSPTARLTLFSASLLVTATALVLGVQSRTGPPVWWVFAAFVAAFTVSEVTQLHVEFRRETVSASLSEIPLVLALFSMSPTTVVLARLAGAAIVFAARRTPIHKSLFNAGLFAAESAIAATLFAVAVQPGPLRPRDLIFTFLCIAAAEIASTVSVLAAMAILGGRITASVGRQVFGSVALSGTLNTTLALVVVIVVQFNPAGIVLLVVIAVVTVMAYRAHSDLLRKHTNLGQLYDLSRELSAAPTDAALRAVLLDRCRTVLRAERVVLREPLDAGGDELIAEILRTGRPVVASRRSRLPAVRGWLAGHRLRDAVLAPLGDGGGINAVLQVENRMGEMSTFTADDARMLETITTHAEAALRANRSLAQLRHDARHDALTGLGNRTLLFTEIDEHLTRNGTGSILLLDLDRFKEVNDALGHRIGDVLLREVARRLAARLLPEVTLARLGGDEFAVLLPASPTAAEAVNVAEEIRVALREPFEVEGTTLEARASIGIAVLGEHGRDAMSLLQHADVAMYAAKRVTSGVAVYSSDDHVANLRRLALSRELRHGVETGEIKVFYQPKVALRSGDVVGMEALARWQSARRGLVMPDEFIPVAEQTGLIAVLTEGVLHAALFQVRSWLASGIRVGVSVNLSARGLLEPGMPARVAQALTDFDVPPALLTLEITETSLMVDFERTIEVLAELVALGITLSLDDFGTGYSSLAYLQRLPVAELKIDKSFVWAMAAQPTGSAIVQAVIDLAHTLNLEVVAEGVEDEPTREALLKMGCDAMQGYLLSRPMPAKDATQWLHRRTLRVPEQAGRRGARRLRTAC